MDEALVKTIKARLRNIGYKEIDEREALEITEVCCLVLKEHLEEMDPRKTKSFSHPEDIAALDSVARMIPGFNK